MRLLYLFPFTLIAGVDGFAIFAPYLMLVLLVLHVRRTLRGRKFEFGRRLAGGISDELIPAIN